MPSPFNQEDLSLVYAAIFLVISCYHWYRYLYTKEQKVPPSVARHTSEPAERLAKALASALPDETILPEDATSFLNATDIYWDQQESERVPSCIVQPQTVESVSTAVKILKHAYAERVLGCRKNDLESGLREAGLFAVRSGGHSPVSGAASIDGGVIIDLSKFNSIKLSQDEDSIEVGSGCRWGDISRILDDKNLAVVGGRNSHVGVGGLLLAGGISFFSPQYGFAANNVISYEIITADGSILTASQKSHPSLWRALKGGSNNLGIVTRFTLRTLRLSTGKIWGGWLYLPGFQATRVLAGLHSVLSAPLDEHAAGPLASFTYIQQIGMQIISTSLVYTRPTASWPPCFGPLKPIWRLWSTCKQQTLTSVTDEMETLSPPHLRQAYGTTTITNDAATLAEAHATYKDGMHAVRGVKGTLWTMVFQPLHPTWLRKGDPNPMGLQDCPDAPLVLVSYTVSWYRPADDELVHREVKKGIERIEAFAEKRGTGYPYKFHNYCGEWQDPFAGYAKEGKSFLQRVSREYDPEGLFQRGCVGGFKLGLDEKDGYSCQTSTRE
ncbi:FAD binding domain-containing protein [Paraphaeosphaeria sporulosa]|uniref:FAD binding domain-containing protein n=1 Tax=Paraphaeosphaeria sporulosa TaxID=1460663 RepID=A0A177BXI9_9PLEO|nr:FAD binding domain-containing protein [Paraphaeosphaeria sporulosa]OAG00035.1 FAD binding domain-containing protein [Paraphaeosphaeria sporulosa]